MTLHKTHLAKATRNNLYICQNSPVLFDLAFDKNKLIQFVKIMISFAAATGPAIVTDLKVTAYRMFVRD